MEIQCWEMTASGAPLSRGVRGIDETGLSAGHVLIEVAGCGVCHTDLGFLYDGVRTRQELPLTLGHEISGRVVGAGLGAEDWVDRAVVVPAVTPCGECAQCRAGRGAVCSQQFFPGNDADGGFASHVMVPARGLCAVDEERLESSSVDLASLSVIADAVTTPYQAILNAKLKQGDVAIFVGIGGVGGFGVQIAHHLGASVVAIDVVEGKLDRIAEHGADLCIVAADDHRAIKRQIRTWVKDSGLPKTGWKIFETSGHRAGQALAYSLLGYDAHLAVVGYTRDKIEVRLSNLMAFDATVRGTWGCLPEHYPAVVDLVLSGAVDVESFSTRRPMSEINATFEALRERAIELRPVLVPDFD